MIITIHQPEHMPWPGFFHKMAMADQYVVLDHVQYKKGNYQNRNRLISKLGEMYWCSVPLESGRYSDLIMHKKISVAPWRRKYLNRIADSYQGCLYYSEYYDDVSNIINSGHEYLVDLNLELINWFRGVLKIDTPMLRSKDLDVQGYRSELNLNICKELKATTYLSGPSGRDYLDYSSFKDAGVDIVFHDFVSPKYQSVHYKSGLSMLDVLMNCGPDSRSVLGL